MDKETITDINILKYFNLHENTESVFESDFSLEQYRVSKTAFLRKVVQKAIFIGRIRL